MEGLSTFLTDVTAFGTEAFNWIGKVAEFVMANPVPFVMVAAIPIFGVGIGYCKRLFNLS